MNLWDKLKLAWKVKEPAEKLIDGIKDFKSGWKTIPFWVTLLGAAGSVVAAFQGIIPPEASLITSTVLAGIYNFIRGYEKLEQDAIRPTLKSTEFWIGLGTMISNTMLALKTGGISPDWLVTAQTSMATAMALAQNLGAQTPTN